MATLNLDTEYHRQEDPLLCGAACAQMILHQIDNTIYELQTDLSQYADDHRGEDGWAAEPDGLKETMIQYDQRPSLTYVVFDEDISPDYDIAVDRITRKIVWTLFNYKIPPILCTQNGNHWILVTGYEITKDPKDNSDTDYQFIGFYINNPFPDVPPGTDHNSSDICSKYDRGGSTSYVPLDGWKEVVTPVNLPGSKWYGRLITICDPEPAPKKSGERIPVVHKSTGEKIIKPEEAVELVTKALKELPESLKSKLAKVVEYLKAGKPVLVKRIDHSNDFYYIVPVNGINNKTYVVVRLDARYGNIWEVSYTKNLERPFQSNLLSPKKIKSLAINAIQSGKKGFKKIFLEALFIHPVMIWKPCKQSLNPYYPFYVVLYGRKRLYVRIDGKVYKKLTNDLLGM